MAPEVVVDSWSWLITLHNVVVYNKTIHSMEIQQLWNKLFVKLDQWVVSKSCSLQPVLTIFTRCKMTSYSSMQLTKGQPVREPSRVQSPNCTAVLLWGKSMWPYLQLLQPPSLPRQVLSALWLDHARSLIATIQHHYKLGPKAWLCDRPCAWKVLHNVVIFWPLCVHCGFHDALLAYHVGLSLIHALISTINHRISTSSW